MLELNFVGSLFSDPWGHTLKHKDRSLSPHSLTNLNAEVKTPSLFSVGIAATAATSIRVKHKHLIFLWIDQLELDLKLLLLLSWLKQSTDCDNSFETTRFYWTPEDAEERGLTPQRSAFRAPLSLRPRVVNGMVLPLLAPRLAPRLASRFSCSHAPLVRSPKSVGSSRATSIEHQTPNTEHRATRC